MTSVADAVAITMLCVFVFGVVVGALLLVAVASRREAISTTAREIQQLADGGPTSSN